MKIWIIIIGTILSVAGVLYAFWNISRGAEPIISWISLPVNLFLFCYWVHLYVKWCDETWG